MKKFNAMKDLNAEEDAVKAWEAYRVAIFRGTEDVLTGAPSASPLFMDSDNTKELAR